MNSMQKEVEEEVSNLLHNKSKARDYQILPEIKKI